ncbi:TolC family outer membrane protein [Marivivens marinus]|uniref:TolC family outer membrane protein n=1 Tax=Marivivens marinus TaxID=3110173 RepID=UPI003B845D27
MRIGRGLARLGLVLGLALAAPLARADSFAAALTDAYNNSGLLDQNRALLRVADEDVAIAAAGLRPIVSWAASATHSWPAPSPDADEITFNLGISANLTLYDGGASQLAIRAQQENVLATRQALINVEQQVLLRAATAYLNVQRDSEFVNLRRSNVRVLTEEFRAAQDRFDVGEVTRTDVSLAEARLAAARSLLAAAEGNLARSVEEFRAAVGRRPGTLSSAPRVPLSRSVEQAKAYAVQRHPQILQAQHAVTGAELNIQRAEAALRPTVDLGGRLNFDNDFNDSGSISLSVGGPIYSGGAIEATIRQARARRDASRAQLHVTSAGIQQGVGNAYAIYSVARAGREAYERQVRAARVAFEGVREEANLGARTTLDVLNAEQELLDAQANLVSAQIDEILAGYSILSSMGLLTAEQLRLDVQTYDPEAYYNLVKDAPAGLSPQGRALDRVLQSIGN